MATALETIVSCPNCGAKNRINTRAAESKQPVCGRCGTRLSAGAPSAPAGDPGQPVELTDATFDAFLNSTGNRPVLVDCWAEWCAPCQMLAPTIEALAKEAGGKYLVAKLDTDANPLIASRYGISSIPTMLIFKKGQLVDQLVGVQQKPAIAARLAKHAK